MVGKKKRDDLKKVRIQPKRSADLGLIQMLLSRFRVRKAKITTQNKKTEFSPASGDVSRKTNSKLAPLPTVGFCSLKNCYFYSKIDSNGNIETKYVRGILKK